MCACVCITETHQFIIQIVVSFFFLSKPNKKKQNLFIRHIIKKIVNEIKTKPPTPIFFHLHLIIVIGMFSSVNPWKNVECRIPKKCFKYLDKYFQPLSCRQAKISHNSIATGGFLHSHRLSSSNNFYYIYIFYFYVVVFIF